MNYRSFADLARDTKAWCETLPRDLDLIVGVPRSGLLAANLVALHRNLPLTDLEGLLEGRMLSTGPRYHEESRARITSADLRAGGLNVLVVDDCVSTGAAMQEVSEQVAPILDKHHLLLGAVYVAPSADTPIDVFHEYLNQPYIFEWNLLHSGWVSWSCFALDGVLCRRPTGEEKKDKAQYQRFVTTVAPKLVPTQPIARIVTGRPETYREQTECWLARHEIPYETLTMREDLLGASRRWSRSDAAYKAEVYSEYKKEEKQKFYRLFIEGNKQRALQIARLSGKPVFCVENMQMVNPAIMSSNGFDSKVKDHHRYGALVNRGRRAARRALGKVLREAHALGRRWL